MNQLNRRNFLTVLGTSAAGAYGVTAFSCDQKREAERLRCGQCHVPMTDTDEILLANLPSRCCI